jgi:carbonic anhydrase
MPRLSRRQFLALTGAAASGAWLAACTRETNVSPLTWKTPPTLAPTPTVRGPEKLNADAALARLLDGNQRYMASGLVHPDQMPARRQALTSQQAPFAIVLTCADSRVPPEVVFDQGLGDLFVVRVAGNILSDTLLGSIEYAADHLKAPLVLVLGHARCGALEAAVAAVQSGSEAPGHIASLVAALRPAVEAAQRQSGDVLDNAVRANVKLVAAQLRERSPILEEKMGKEGLKVVGAYCNLDTGAVEVLS